MTLDPSLLEFLQDTITIEPYVSETAARVPTYGTAVTHKAMVMPWTGHDVEGLDGKLFRPKAQAAIEGLVSIDPRSRVTLPSSMLIAGTRQPPIRAVQPGPASTLGLDYTLLLFQVLVAIVAVTA